VGAAERIGKAQRLSPELGDEATEILARAYLMQRRPADTVALLRKGPPSSLHPPLLALLMEAYLDLEQPERAAEVLSISPVRARAGVETTVARARLQVERGHDVTAESLATTALLRLRSPTASRVLKAEALMVLGRAQWEEGDFRPALRALKSAIELDPKSAAAFCYYGMANQDLHNLDEAKKALETAVQINPRYSDAVYFLGRMRADLGDPRAPEQFKAYLEMAPKGTYADDARRALGLTPTNAPPRKRRRGR
jgi:tetratricopeptide (TPR) repeat protein